MVRGDEHVTATGPFGDKAVEGSSFKVAGEQDAAPCRFHRDHQTRFVVSRTPPPCFVPLDSRSSGMEDSDPAQPVERDLIPLSADSHRDPGLVDPPQDLCHCRRLALQERFRNNHAAHREPLDQIGDAVEMVGVGVRDHQRVDPLDALAPQHRRKTAAGGDPRPESSGVIHEATTSWSPDHDAATMPHRCDHSFERGGGATWQDGDEQSDAGPGGGGTGPGERPHQPRPGHEEEDRQHPDVPAGDPPSRRPADPREGPRNSGSLPDHDVDHRQTCVTHSPADGSQRHAHRAQRQTDESPHHCQPHQRRNQRVEQQPHRAGDVERTCHQRRCRQPHRRADEDRIGDVTAAAPQPTLHRPAGVINQPRDRIVVAPAGRHRRGRPDEHRRRQERQLAPDAEQFGRMPGEHDDRGHGQRIDPRRTAPRRSSQTSQPHQQRRPEDGGLGSHQQHVEPRQHRHSHQRRPPRKACQTGNDHKRPRQKCHMQTGNGENVDRTGDHEGVDGTGSKAFTGSEDEFGGQGGARRRYMVCQRQSPTGPQPVEETNSRWPSGQRHDLQTFFSRHTDHRQTACPPGPGPLVELPGVSW